MERGVHPSSSDCWDRGCARLVGLVADEGDDHAVQVEEEHDQVEAKLDERLLVGVSRYFVARERACV